MNAAAVRKRAMYNFDRDLTDISHIAGDVGQSDYLYLSPKENNLIACVLKLGTARDKNVSDAKKGIEALRAGSLRRGWNAYDKDE